jgi:hypothetical protein
VATHLTPLRAEVGVAAAPTRRGVGPAFADLLEGQAFEDAETTFTQAGVGNDLTAAATRHGLRGLEGAQQVAGIDDIQPLLGHGQRQAVRLPAAGFIERHVELALDAGVDIPRRLAVADGEDAGDFALVHVSWPPGRPRASCDPRATKVPLVAPGGRSEATWGPTS